MLGMRGTVAGRERGASEHPQEQLVRITENGKARNYVVFICDWLSRSRESARDDSVGAGSGSQLVVLVARKRACSKAVSVAETVKRLMPAVRLRQTTTIGPALLASAVSGESNEQRGTEGQVAMELDQESSEASGDYSIRIALLVHD